ncbi:MAG: class II aldolase/adducin family protein [Rubrivivax sp.]|nr:class II aldolase/adducin family protein [Rubrivivax sp.]
MMPGTQAEARAAVVDAMRRLDALGLNRGSTGNASVRWGIDGHDGMLITPTGMAADRLQPLDLAWVGDDGTVQGPWAPSSEWQFHQATYRCRPDVQAVLHTHAVHATALACLGQPLPAFHYMVAVAGGDDVPLVPYFTFGTEALAAAVGQALGQRDACLLAQHGIVTCGPTVAHAMKVMREIDSLCETYLLARSVTTPAILSGEEMARVREKFRGYAPTRRVD